jgi:hypothetical protein
VVTPAAPDTVETDEDGVATFTLTSTTVHVGAEATVCAATDMTLPSAPVILDAAREDPLDLQFTPTPTLCQGVHYCLPANADSPAAERAAIVTAPRANSRAALVVFLAPGDNEPWAPKQTPWPKTRSALWDVPYSVTKEAGTWHRTSD